MPSRSGCANRERITELVSQIDDLACSDTDRESESPEVVTFDTKLLNTEMENEVSFFKLVFDLALGSIYRSEREGRWSINVEGNTKCRVTTDE